MNKVSMWITGLQEAQTFARMSKQMGKTMGALLNAKPNIAPFYVLHKEHFMLVRKGKYSNSRMSECFPGGK